MHLTGSRRPLCGKLDGDPDRPELLRVVRRPPASRQHVLACLRVRAGIAQQQPVAILKSRPSTSPVIRLDQHAWFPSSM